MPRKPRNPIYEVKKHLSYPTEISKFEFDLVNLIHRFWSNFPKTKLPNSSDHLRNRVTHSCKSQITWRSQEVSLQEWSKQGKPTENTKPPWGSLQFTPRGYLNQAVRVVISRNWHLKLTGLYSCFLWGLCYFFSLFGSLC